MQLETITELLNIPNQKVIQIVQNTKDRLELVLEPIDDAVPVCSGCGRVHNSYPHSRSYAVIEDLPISGKRVFLHICKRKVFCPEDGRIRVEEFNWIRKRFAFPQK
jgi:transposase